MIHRTEEAESSACFLVAKHKVFFFFFSSSWLASIIGLNQLQSPAKAFSVSASSLLALWF